ncbi:MAG: ABC transporter ATP-binding protein [Pseudomonadota bacterium]
MGPSGSGKTTLLNCICGIDQPDRGEVCIAGDTIDYQQEAVRVSLRRDKIGVVFQFFNLIASLTVSENVALPFRIAGEESEPIKQRTEEALREVGLSTRGDHYPDQLSGGEMQLVSLARALIREPVLLLADEPTGNLNPDIGRRVMSNLRDRARAKKTSVLLVTHSAEHAAWCHRVCFLNDGQLRAEMRPSEGAARDVYRYLSELGI